MKISNVCSIGIVVLSSLYLEWITLPKATRLRVAIVILAVVIVFASATQC
jgi:multisubunit Na+/H+ antiporter MnhG subunit